MALTCDVCKRPVHIKDRKYVIYIVAWVHTRQICLCKSCIAKGSFAKSGTIVAEREKFEVPRLVVRKDLSPDSAFSQAASAEGWRVTGLPLSRDIPEEGYLVKNVGMVISRHFNQAMLQRFFSPAGDWVKDVEEKPVELFRRSCIHIRDYWAQYRRREL